MPILPDAERFEEPLDPSDLRRYKLEFSSSEPLLDAGETVAAWDITVEPDSAAIGLQLGTGAAAPTKTGATTWLVWLKVDPAQQANERWLGDGVDCAIVLHVTSNSVPPQEVYRSAIVRVQHQ